MSQQDLLIGYIEEHYAAPEAMRPFIHRRNDEAIARLPESDTLPCPSSARWSPSREPISPSLRSAGLAPSRSRSIRTISVIPWAIGSPSSRTSSGNWSGRRPGCSYAPSTTAGSTFTLSPVAKTGTSNSPIPLLPRRGSSVAHIARTAARCSTSKALQSRSGYTTQPTSATIRPTAVRVQRMLDAAHAARQPRPRPDPALRSRYR